MTRPGLKVLRVAVIIGLCLHADDVQAEAIDIIADFFKGNYSLRDAIKVAFVATAAVSELAHQGRDALRNSRRRLRRMKRRFLVSQIRDIERHPRTHL
jgi:hypothetical protein